MQRVKIKILLVVLLGLFVPGYSQYIENDAALWLNASVEKKLSDKIVVQLNQKNRIYNNFSHYGLGYADLGLYYKINKHIRLQGDYVFGLQRNYKNESALPHQFYLAITFKQKINRFTYLYRNMVQMRYKSYFTSETGTIPKLYERNKFTVKYELNKKMTFYVSEEIRYPFDQTRNKGLNRSRSSLGLEYSFSKTIVVQPYFTFQQELNAFNKTNRDFIYGLGFSYEF
jgi:hypothetical protein